MQNLKTTLAGLAIGLYPIIDAVLNALVSGQFEGKTGVELVLGLAVVALGVIAHDPKKSTEAN
jgi:hypothetical protein